MQLPLGGIWKWFWRVTIRIEKEGVTFHGIAAEFLAKSFELFQQKSRSALFAALSGERRDFIFYCSVIDCPIAALFVALASGSALDCGLASSLSAHFAPSSILSKHGSPSRYEVELVARMRVVHPNVAFGNPKERITIRRASSGELPGDAEVIVQVGLAQFFGGLFMQQDFAITDQPAANSPHLSLEMLPSELIPML